MKIKESELNEMSKKSESLNNELAVAINNLAKAALKQQPAPQINNIIDLEGLIQKLPKQVDNSKELTEINQNLSKIVDSMNDTSKGYEMDIKRGQHGAIQKVVVKSIKF